MATETNLTKVNIFPSEESYNTNKNSLGAGELALIPVNNYGVVEVGNGYMVFGNGLILQWGHVEKQQSDWSNSTDLTITFGKPFSNTNYIFVSTATDMNNNTDHPHAYVGYMYNSSTPVKSTTGVQVRVGENGHGRDWIAIGT